MHPNDDTRGIDRVDHAAAARDDRHARVDRNRTLHAGADQRRFGAQRRNSLTLHVRAHQGAVRVVVLEERNQRRRDRNDLLRRNVHVLNLVRRRQHELVQVTARHEVVRELSGIVQCCVCLRDDVLALFDRGEIVDLFRDLAVDNLAIRRLEEAVVVRTRIHRQRIDEADVRTFRRFDRAHTAVVSRVHVAHLESGAFARQTAWAERRHAALVRDFRKRVVLIHELRELRRAEELLHRSRDRLRVDHFLRHQAFGFRERQTLLHRTLDTHEADAEGVLRHLTYRTHAAIAEVIDVVDLSVAVADVAQLFDDGDDVRARLIASPRLHGLAVLLDELLRELVVALREMLVVVQDARADDLIAMHTTIELHASDCREIVALRIEEQVLEQVLGRILRRRLAGTHHAIDLDERFEARARRVDAQRIGDVRAAIEIVHVQHANLIHTRFDQLVDDRNGEDVVRLRQDLAGFRIEHIVREHLADQVFLRHFQARDVLLLEHAHVTRGHATTFLDDDLIADLDRERRGLAAQTRRNQIELDLVLRQVIGVLVEEHVEHLLLGVPERAQDDRDRELAAAVDTREHAVLRVELEIEPRAAIRNDSSGEQELARAVRLTAVVIEEHARAAMQLRHDDALGAVHDERTVVGHERHFAQIHFLLADVLHRLLRRRRRFFVVHDEAHLHAQRSRIREAAQLALLHIEHRVAEAIAHVLENRIARVAGDRKHALERGVQARVVAAILSDIGLQELAIGIQLDREQVRHLEDALPLAEVFTDALFLGERIRHLGSPIQFGPLGNSSRRRKLAAARHRAPPFETRNRHKHGKRLRLHVRSRLRYQPGSASESCETARARASRPATALLT